MSKKFKLNMFKSDFGLNEKHLDKKDYLNLWNSESLVSYLHKEGKGKPLFLLHDGPPYANGNLHLGHFTNKVLKDTVLRYKRLNGYFAPFVPGFDCHGLPIELAVEKETKKDDKVSFAKACREYALSQVGLQTNEFKSFGVCADWDSSYKTMNFSFEAKEMKLLLEFYKLGFLQNKLRPVHWCPSCASSLAEAEVEYQQKKSDSLTVKFKVVGEENLFLLVWTTTPYTLPANKAVAYNKKFKYVKEWNQELNEFYVMLSDDLSKDEFVLENLKVVSPYSQQEVPLVAADYVSKDGTGFVHLAPSFGTDDFKVGEMYGLPVEKFVNNYGQYDSSFEELNGKNLKEVAKLVLESLSEKGLVFNLSSVEHEYPHCWRHKTPLFFKTSSEWFVDLSDKEKFLNVVDNVNFLPSSGRERLLGMLKNRNSWCVSRNRVWGVPLPLFFNLDGSVVENNDDLVSQVLLEVEKRGVEAWLEFETPPNVVKSNQTLDVWFDSGVTHEVVLKDRFGVLADLYLEGSDQHRGWFQSSLLTSTLLNQKAPYKNVLTHGFVVDEKGKKLSKSMKNYVSLDKLFESFSPDVLRLWVLGQDFTLDLKFSNAALSQSFEKYKKFRNTFRFCLQNTEDFNFSETLKWLSETKNPHNLNLMFELEKLLNSVKEKSESYSFNSLVQECFMFAEKVSSLYFDVVKDTLYCDYSNSNKRKEVQAVLVALLHLMLCVLSPLLPFSTEEVFGKVKDKFGFDLESVSQLTFESLNSYFKFKLDLGEQFEFLNNVRKLVNKFVDDNVSEGVKTTEELSVTLFVNETMQNYLSRFSLENLLDFLCVSELHFKNSELLSVFCEKTTMHKCPCCWRFNSEKEDSLCLRCEEVQL